MCLFLMGAGAGAGSGVEMVRGAAEAGAVLGWGTAGTGLKLAGMLGLGAGAGVGTPEPSLCCRGAGRPEDGAVYNGDTVYNGYTETHFLAVDPVPGAMSAGHTALVAMLHKCTVTLSVATLCGLHNK